MWVVQRLIQELLETCHFISIIDRNLPLQKKIDELYIKNNILPSYPANNWYGLYNITGCTG